MERLLIVMLAGSLRPSPLQRSLQEHPLTLPLRHDCSLLDAWLDAFADCGVPCCVRIVVNQRPDARRLSNLLLRRGDTDSESLEIEVVEESSAWRGSGGLIRDMASDSPGEDPVVVVEAACLPPRSIRPAVDRLATSGEAVVGAMYSREPAGVYLFRRSAIERIPRIGYFDMKEQLIPALSAGGASVHLAVLGERALRIRDRRSYLDAVKEAATTGPAVAALPYPGAPHGTRVVGATVIEAGAGIGVGVVLQNAVILQGAMIGDGAVVARSVVGRGAAIDAGERVVDAIVARSASPLRSWKSARTQTLSRAAS